MTPSDDQEALMHIRDIRFASAGKKFLCVSCISHDNCATKASIETGYMTNLQKMYTTTFLKSDNISAFMTVIQ